MPAREKNISSPAMACGTRETVTTVARRITEHYDMEVVVTINDEDGDFFGQITWRDIVRIIGDEIDPRITPISEII